jgi:hypothetical protein
MNHITMAALRVVLSSLAPAKARTHKPALLMLAAACLFGGATVKAAGAPARAQTGQTSLPADLVQVQASEVPDTVRTWFSASHYPFWPPLPPSGAGGYPGAVLYLSPSLNAILVDDFESTEATAAQEPIPIQRKTTQPTIQTCT